MPRRALAAAALLIFAAGCAARRGPALEAQLDRAAALAAEGCYDCLREALALQLAVIPPKDGTPRAVRLNTEIFRVSLLLALRSKELGLDAAPYLSRARTHASRTAAPASAAEQLAWAERLPGNPSAVGRDVAEAERAALNGRAREIEQRFAAAAAASDPLDVYLNVSLACAREFFRETPKPEAVAAPAASQPLVQWRVAICGRVHEDALRAFVAAHPRYVEADYWLGRYRMALIGDPTARREVRARLQAVDAAIPGSPAIALDLAGVIRVTSPKDALPLYERITRADARHQDAWLGQGICLTYLERPRDAVDALTRVVDLGRWFLADALYWRAWNRHTLGELEAAWADIERARQSLYNTDVYGLAGRIAFDRKDLDTARERLERARELDVDRTNCSAVWFLGLVHTNQERWVLGAEVFEAAEQCYGGEIGRIRAQQAIDSREPEEAVRAARLAQSDASIRTAERQAALSAYNAAFAFIRGERRDRSRPLLERAVQHEEVNDRARELLAFLDR
jgi:tetratricopeptide (TPR) repeat protein